MNGTACGDRPGDRLVRVEPTGDAGGTHSAVGMAEVAELMKCSYRLIAPKRLAAAVRES